MKTEEDLTKCWTVPLRHQIPIHILSPPSKKSQLLPSLTIQIRPELLSLTICTQSHLTSVFNQRRVMSECWWVFRIQVWSLNLLILATDHQTPLTNVVILRVVELKQTLLPCETLSLKNSKSLCPSCKFSIKSKHKVVCLLVKSVSLWQHVCISMFFCVWSAKVLPANIQQLFEHSLHWFHHLHPIYERRNISLMLNMSHFTKTINSNNIGFFFVPMEKVPKLP